METEADDPAGALMLQQADEAMPLPLPPLAPPPRLPSSPSPSRSSTEEGDNGLHVMRAPVLDDGTFATDIDCDRLVVLSF
jgi:hypothetical protein